MGHAIAMLSARGLKITCAPLIAYVPAGDCHLWKEYQMHETEQRRIFEGQPNLIPTPSLRTFGLIYEQQFGDKMCNQRCAPDSARAKLVGLGDVGVG